MDSQQQADLEIRLDNWGAWARSRGGESYGRCGSAERQYLPPKDPDGERLAQSARVPIDVGDAELIEIAILKLQRSIDRKLLVWTYVEHRQQYEVAKGLCCPPILVRPHVIRVIGALQYRLDCMAKQSVNRGRSKRQLQPKSAIGYVR